MDFKKIIPYCNVDNYSFLTLPFFTSSSSAFVCLLLLLRAATSQEAPHTEGREGRLRDATGSTHTGLCNAGRPHKEKNGVSCFPILFLSLSLSSKSPVWCQGRIWMDGANKIAPLLEEGKAPPCLPSSSSSLSWRGVAEQKAGWEQEEEEARRGEERRGQRGIKGKRGRRSDG